MTRTERIANLAGVVVPLLGVIAAIVLLWNRAVDATDLAVMAVMYLITAFGITIGFHRLLTHRAFQTKRWLQHWRPEAQRCLKSPRTDGHCPPIRNPSWNCCRH